MGMVSIHRPGGNERRILRKDEIIFNGEELSYAKITLPDGLFFSDIDTMIVVTGVQNSVGAYSISTKAENRDDMVWFYKYGRSNGVGCSTSGTTSTFAVAKRETGEYPYTLFDALIVLKV